VISHEGAKREVSNVQALQEGRVSDLPALEGLPLREPTVGARDIPKERRWTQMAAYETQRLIDTLSQNQGASPELLEAYQDDLTKKFAAKFAISTAAVEEFLEKETYTTEYGLEVEVLEAALKSTLTNWEEAILWGAYDWDVL